MDIPEWIRESNLIEGVDDAKEDRRCARAWKELQDKDWSLGAILWLHGRIMRVLEPRIAGKIRCCRVWVTFNGQSSEKLNPILARWALLGMVHDFSHHWNLPDDEASIKQAHINFELMHPFEDGNGRTGRMLMNWQRVKAGLEPLCIYASERHEYYKWFHSDGVSDENLCSKQLEE